MEATSATSLLLAKHQAKLAAAVAGRMADVNPGAARDAASMITESAEEVKKVAAEIAAGGGANLDVDV